VRTAFFGTSEFAATVLRALAASPYRPALVVTPPDRPRGRGRRMGSPPAAVVARGAGIELLQAADVNDPGQLDRLRGASIEVGVVCAFGQLIREPLLSELEMLNLHPSLLPRWRGAAPIERTIMAGDEASGVTIMRVTEGLDSGPIALQEPIEVGPAEGFESLSEQLAELGAVLTLRALELRDQGELELREQDDAAATYADKIGPDERALDPGRPAVELERAVRALNPHIGTHLQLEGGDRLGVRRAAAKDGGLEAGRIAVVEGGLRLGCARGELRLDEVQPPGSRPMPAEAYLRGHDAPGRAV
jgi:methionyl-tRNA formyltransferase